jgi:hypothetical protein
MGNTKSIPTPGSILTDGTFVPPANRGGLNQACNLNKSCNTDRLECNNNNICKITVNSNCTYSSDCISGTSNSCSIDPGNSISVCHFTQKMDIMKNNKKEKFTETKKKPIFKLK